MKDKSFADAYGKDFIENWSNLTRIKKPIIAAVNGFAVCCYHLFYSIHHLNQFANFYSLAADASWP